MKIKILKTFLVLLSIFSIISLGIFIKDQITLGNENRLKGNLQSTDLSTVLIDSHKLGENIKSIDKRIFLLYCENGKYFSGFGQKESFNDCISKRIVAFLSKEGAEISYREEKLTSYKAIIEKLGDSYLKGLPINNYIDTITYIDHKNNIELSFINGEQIIMKRIKDNGNRRTATPIVTFFHNPIYLVFYFVSTFKSKYLFNAYDYVALPLYFTLLTLPISLLFTVKNKIFRIWMIIVVIVLIIVSVIAMFKLMWTAAMGI